MKRSKTIAVEELVCFRVGSRQLARTVQGRENCKNHTDHVGADFLLPIGEEFVFFVINKEDWGLERGKGRNFWLARALPPVGALSMRGF